jgi:hypothetical protein
VLFTIGAKTDFFGKDTLNFSSVPTDCDAATKGCEKLKIGDLPAADDEGNNFVYANGPNDPVQILDSNGDVATFAERVLANGNKSIRAPGRSLAATTYSLVYTGGSVAAGATSSNFRLVVYDASGAIISDISYSVPVSGTMASKGLDTTPIIVTIGSGTPVPGTPAPGPGTPVPGPTQKPTTIEQKLDELETKSNALIIVVMIFLFIAYFVVGWGLFAYWYQKFKNQPKPNPNSGYARNENAIDMSNILWWHWVLLAICPIALLIILGMSKPSRVEDNSGTIKNANIAPSGNSGRRGSNAGYILNEPMPPNKVEASHEQNSDQFEQ